MAKSTALSPEVQGLLEKVRLQAQQYSEAFEYFEKKQKEFDKLLNTLDSRHSEFSQFLLQLKSEILKIKDDFSSTTESNLKAIRNELQKYAGFNENYQKLINFVEELKLYKKEINEKVSHYENNLENFKSELGFDLDNSINSLREKIEEEIDNNIETVEKDISKRFSIAEKMIIEIKNHLIQIEKKSDNEIKILQNLLEKNKNQSLDYTSSLERNFKKEQKRIDLIEKNIKQEFQKTYDKISEILSITKFLEDADSFKEDAHDYDFSLILAKYFHPSKKIESHFEKIESIIDNKVDIMNANIEDLNYRFHKNKNIMIAMFGFGFFLILAIIVLLFASVL